LKYSSKKPTTYLLALFLLLGITALAATTTQAQWGYGQNRDDRYRRDRNDRDRNDRYGRNGDYGYNNAYQIARQQGYRNGLSTGASDAQRGQSYNPQRSHFWKNGTDGYNSSYGNKGQFKQIFRDAFVQGYNEGYQRYGNNRRGNNGRGNGRWGNGRWPR
jgi:hypothetical protein